MLKVPLRCGLMGGLPLLKLATGPCRSRMRAIPCKLLGVISLTPENNCFWGHKIFLPHGLETGVQCVQHGKHGFSALGAACKHLAPVHRVSLRITATRRPLGDHPTLCHSSQP